MARRRSFAVSSVTIPTSRTCWSRTWLPLWRKSSLYVNFVKTIKCECLCTRSELRMVLVPVAGFQAVCTRCSRSRHQRRAPASRRRSSLQDVLSVQRLQEVRPLSGGTCTFTTLRLMSLSPGGFSSTLVRFRQTTATNDVKSCTGRRTRRSARRKRRRCRHNADVKLFYLLFHPSLLSCIKVECGIFLVSVWTTACTCMFICYLRIVFKFRQIISAFQEFLQQTLADKVLKSCFLVVKPSWLLLLEINVVPWIVIVWIFKHSKLKIHHLSIKGVSCKVCLVCVLSRR